VNSGDLDNHRCFSEAHFVFYVPLDCSFIEGINNKSPHLSDYDRPIVGSKLGHIDLGRISYFQESEP